MRGVDNTLRLPKAQLIPAHVLTHIPGSRERGLDYTFNVDVVSYTGGVRHTHNANKDGSTGRADADQASGESGLENLA